MNIFYLLTPAVAWLVSGSLKFIINYTRYGRGAVEKIGNGGFPSTHTSIVSSVLFLLLFMNESPAMTSIALALLLIVIIDATGIRRTIGRHAYVINKISISDPEHHKLREKQGHNWIEIVGGLIVGGLLGWAISIIIQNLSWG